MLKDKCKGKCKFSFKDLISGSVVLSKRLLIYVEIIYLKFCDSPECFFELYRWQ